MSAEKPEVRSQESEQRGAWAFGEMRRRVALMMAAREWIGTPFLEGCGARAKAGACADCVSLPAAVLRSVGAIGAVPWPKRYVSIGGGAAMLAVMVDVLANIPGLWRDWDRTKSANCPPLLAGDLLLCSAGDRLHHLILCLSAVQGIHSWGGRVAYCSPADHPKLRYALFRCYEPATDNRQPTTDQ